MYKNTICAESQATSRIRFVLPYFSAIVPMPIYNSSATILAASHGVESGEMSSFHARKIALTSNKVSTACGAILTQR